MIEHNPPIRRFLDPDPEPVPDVVRGLAELEQYRAELEMREESGAAPDEPPLPLPVLDGLAFMAAPDPAESWLVDQIVPTGGCGFLVGPPKTLKSWLALDLALAVCTGTPWLNRQTVPGKVLLIDAETSPPRLKERLRMMRDGRGVTAADLANLRVLCPGRVLLTDPATMARFRLVLQIIQPRLVVLDCWSRFSTLDENSASEVAPFLGDLRDAINAAVPSPTPPPSLLILHHDRKSGDGSNGSARARGGRRLRGTGDLHAWYDFAAFVDRDGNRPNVTVSFESRYTEEPPDMDAELRVVDGEAVILAGDQPPPPDRRDQIAALVAATPDGMTARQIREALKISGDRLDPLLRQLLAANRLRQFSRKVRGKETTVYGPV